MILKIARELFKASTTLEKGAGAMQERNERAKKKRRAMLIDRGAQLRGFAEVGG